MSPFLSGDITMARLQWMYQECGFCSCFCHFFGMPLFCDLKTTLKLDPKIIPVFLILLNDLFSFLPQL